MLIYQKTIPVPFQFPSTIYDPSLRTPYYGINDRQPVDPLTDAANDLIRPMIQSIIADQTQKNDRVFIKDAVKSLIPEIPKNGCFDLWWSFTAVDLSKVVPTISKVNNEDKGIFNNKRFKIVELDTFDITIKDELKNKLKINITDFQKYNLVAYGTSIQTITKRAGGLDT